MMENVIVKIEKLKDRLQTSSRYDQVIMISREIFFMNIEREIDNFSNLPVDTFKQFVAVLNEFQNLLIQYLMGTKNINVQKIIIKPIFLFSFITNQVDAVYISIRTRYSEKFNVTGASCICTYGWMQNEKLFQKDIFKVCPIEDDFFSMSIQKSRNPDQDSKYFTIAIENLIQAYDIKLIKKNHPSTFITICTNLESGRSNVHKLLLQLFKKVVMAATEDEAGIMHTIMNELSWHNRNKYYLLSYLISVRPEMLLNYEHFDLNTFMNGLRVGLSQYHLYSASLSLVKIIHNREEFRERLMALACDILLNGSIYEVKNLIKLWFSSFDIQFVDKLFKMITEKFDFTKITSTSSDFHRAVLIRNVFNRTVSPQLENSIESFCCNVDDIEIKIEIFNILLNKIYASKELEITIEHILRVLHFLQYNITTVQDSMFIDSVMKKLPQFFNFLATSRFRRIEICKEIFGIIRNDMYFHGIKYGNYESTVFSIKILEVILKQYCGCMKGNRLNKNTDTIANQQFKEFLKINQIWDISSNEIFSHLIKSAEDTENSDLSSIAKEMLVDYFVKTLTIDELKSDFIDWINSKVQKCLNIADIESYHENISYFIMKFEYLFVKHRETVNDEIMKLLVELKLRSMELRQSTDLLDKMETGKNLFVLFDCISYAISKMSENFDLLKMLSTIMKLVAYQFLEFINDGKSPPTFDVLDKNLSELVEKSSWKTDNIADTKHKLLLLIFFTLRSVSELSSNMAKIVSSISKPHDSDYVVIMNNCIEVNVQILTRFCHKGGIESASQALGAITKIISSEFSQQCNRNSEAAKNLQKMLIILKNEIDCGKRHTSKTGEIRGSRGLILMAHHIIRNHPAFLKFLMDRLLMEIQRVSKVYSKDCIEPFYQTNSIRFAKDVRPIHLHLLALLVKDGEIVEEMLRYHDVILSCTFRAYKETNDFVMQNALLQIIGNITPKISNHKRHSIDDKEIPDYDCKSISAYEFCVKMTHSFTIALSHLGDYKSLSQTYIIMLLEIFSNFEFRNPYERNMEISTYLNQASVSFTKLVDHRCEKIRVLAAKCFAQFWFPSYLPKTIKDKVRYVFSKDPNLAHGSIVAVQHMIQRHSSSIEFIEQFDREEFLMTIRGIIVKSSQKEYSSIPENFYLRCRLLDFLMFVGFKFNDNIIQMMMNETSVKSNIGYPLWCQKVKKYRDTSYC